MVEPDRPQTFPEQFQPSDSAAHTGRRNTGLWIVLGLLAGLALISCIGFGLLLSVVGAAFLTVGSAPTYQPVDVYFYDLNTGKLFIGKSSDIPPIDAPSGNLMQDGNATDQQAGVKAYVYSCDDCSVEDSRFVGWLETYTPQLKLQLEDPEALMSSDPDSMEAEIDMMQVFEQGHLIAKPVEPGAEPDWVPATAEEGFALVQEVQETCGPATIPQPCMP